MLASTKECLQTALEDGNDGTVNTSAIEEHIRVPQAETVRLVDKCVKTYSGADAYDEQFKTLADKIKALQARLDAVGSQGSETDNSRLS